MLMPSKTKHRKQQRGRRQGRAGRGNTIVSGEYGLLALANCWLTSRQIEAARVAMTRYIRRAGKVWIRVFPDKPVTAKPAETRMGSGKGSPEYWVAVVKRGRILFEIGGVPQETARAALLKAGHKLPIPTRIVMRHDVRSSTGEDSRA
jgi:large subunit ribosomal protein L16